MDEISAHRILARIRVSVCTWVPACVPACETMYTFCRLPVREAVRRGFVHVVGYNGGFVGARKAVYRESIRWFGDVYRGCLCTVVVVYVCSCVLKLCAWWSRWLAGWLTWTASADTALESPLQKENGTD